MTTFGFATDEEAREYFRVRDELGELGTAELPPHNPDATCPKCGADANRVMTEYHTVALEAFLGQFRLTPNQQPCAGKYLNEHLCRTCGRCGHSWQEHCVVPDAMG